MLETPKPTGYSPPPLPLRLVRAGRALAILARDPSQLDRVFEIGMALNASRITRALDAIERTADGRRLLAERPVIDSAHVDFDALARLADGTLGREYVRFLRDNGITPDVFKAPDIGDARIAYAIQRVRQTHDLWHVLTGFTPDVTGEVLLQVYMYAHMGTPSSLALSLVGAARIARQTPHLLERARDAYRRGRVTRPLATFMWEDHWAEPLSSVRALLACPDAAAPQRLAA